MIKCFEQTILPIDDRAMRRFLNANPHLIFDPQFIEELPNIHGGVPLQPYFRTVTGQSRKISWFVNFLDEQSTLPGPLQPAMYDRTKDKRIDDRSVVSLMDDVLNIFFSGERFVPFAALACVTGDAISLRHYSLDSAPDDSLCLDMSTSPNAVVVYSGQVAAEQTVQWEDGEIDELDYESIVEFVADSFGQFISLLDSYKIN